MEKGKDETNLVNDKGYGREVEEIEGRRVSDKSEGNVSSKMREKCKTSACNEDLAPE